MQHLLSVCLPVIMTFLSEAGVAPRPWDVNPQLSVEVATAAGAQAGAGAAAGASSSGGAAPPARGAGSGFAAASQRIALPVGAAAAAAAAASQRTSPTPPAPLGRAMATGTSGAGFGTQIGAAGAAHRVALPVGSAARAHEADPILQDGDVDDDLLIAMMDEFDPLQPLQGAL